MKSLFVFALMLGCVGCATGVRLPTIAGHHWSRKFDGAELYRDADGVEAASFITSSLGMPAQSCIFEFTGDCQSFEYNQQAVNYVAHVYAENAKAKP